MDGSDLVFAIVFVVFLFIDGLWTRRVNRRLKMLEGQTRATQSKLDSGLAQGAKDMRYIISTFKGMGERIELLAKAAGFELVTTPAKPEEVSYKKVAKSH